MAAARLTLLSFNDVYQFFSDGGIGGLAEASSVLKEEREKGATKATNGSSRDTDVVSVSNSEFIDDESGNRVPAAQLCLTFMPGDFMVVSSVAADYKGSHMVEVLDAMGVDYVVPGNHEFDYGPGELELRVRESHFTWLGSNIAERGAESVVLPHSNGAPHAGHEWPVFPGMLFVDIRSVGEYNVGFFGICTADTELLSFPEDTVFRPPAATARACIAELRRRGADVFVALTHQDMAEDRALARACPDIHVILGGHDHSPFAEIDGTTLVMKCGQNAQFVGRIDLYIDRGGFQGAVRVLPEWQMRSVRHVSPDPPVAALIKKFVSHLDELKDIPLCTVASGLLSSRTAEVRSAECTFGDLVCDVVRARFGETETDVVMMQGGSMRADQHYHVGRTFTQYDLVHEFPFNNIAVYLRITGAVLRATLENGFRALPARAGHFPQLSKTVKVVVDASLPVGSRVVELFVHGKPVCDDDVFNFVCTDFVRKGGDGYVALVDGAKTGECVSLHHEHSNEVVSEILMEWMKSNKDGIHAHLDGRIVKKHDLA